MFWQHFQIPHILPEKDFPHYPCATKTLITFCGTVAGGSRALLQAFRERTKKHSEEVDRPEEGGVGLGSQGWPGCPFCGRLRLTGQCPSHKISHGLLSELPHLCPMHYKLGLVEGIRYTNMNVPGISK